MSRKILTRKRFPQRDIKYNNLLISLLINSILKSGKKLLAKKIVYKALEYIEFKTNQNPILIFEQAIRNGAPLIKLKSKRIGGATYQVPTIVNKLNSIRFAIRWITDHARKRSGKGISIKLANEILETAKGLSNTTKKKDEIHKMAEANKVFAQFN